MLDLLLSIFTIETSISHDEVIFLFCYSLLHQWVKYITLVLFSRQVDEIGRFILNTLY